MAARIPPDEKVAEQKPRDSAAAQFQLELTFYDPFSLVASEGRLEELEFAVA